MQSGYFYSRMAVVLDRALCCLPSTVRGKKTPAKGGERGSDAGMHVCNVHARYDAHLRKGEREGIMRGVNVNCRWIRATATVRRGIIHLSSAFCDAQGAKCALHSTRHYFSADRNGVRMIHCVGTARKTYFPRSKSYSCELNSFNTFHGRMRGKHGRTLVS